MEQIFLQAGLAVVLVGVIGIWVCGLLGSAVRHPKTPGAVAGFTAVALVGLALVAYPYLPKSDHTAAVRAQIQRETDPLWWESVRQRIDLTAAVVERLRPHYEQYVCVGKDGSLPPVHGFGFDTRAYVDVVYMNHQAVDVYTKAALRYAQGIQYKGIDASLPERVPFCT